MMSKEGKLKILFYDIETAPTLGYVWGLYQQDVIRVKENWYILSFAWKFQGDKRIKAYALPDFPNYKKNKKDDSALAQKLWDLLDEADIVIAHNGDRFDQKKSNATFVKHNMTPPSSYFSIDTLKIARKYFKFDSNSLNNLSQFLGMGKKLRTGGFDLWEDCIEGDMKAWRKMVRYNKQDIVLLEKVYLRFRPWVDNHPRVLAHGIKPFSCPKCGSIHLQSRGVRRTKTMTYQRYQCQNCYGWSSRRKAEKVGKPGVIN